MMPGFGNTRTRMLFYSHTGVASGAEQVLLNTLRMLDRTRYEPIVICPDGDLAERVSRLGLSRVSIPTLQARFTLDPRSLWRYLLSFLSIVFSLRRTVTDTRPDVIHANSVRAALVSAVATLGSRIPLIWHIQDDLPNHPLTSLIRVCAHLSSRSTFLCVSQATQTAFCAGWRFERRCHVLHNGLDTNAFPAKAQGDSAFRTELGLACDAFLLVAVGMINPRKDLLGLIRAFKSVHEAHPSAHLAVVGAPMFNKDDLYLAELRTLTGSLGLEASVTFTGSRADVPALLRAADLLVLNALAEPFGLVLVEAMLSGTPVLATSVGGIPEIVTDDVTGFLVPPAQPGLLAARILHVISHPQERARVSVAASIKASTQFSLERYSADYHDTLRRAIASRPQTHSNASASVALFHDNFAQNGGAERVAEHLHRVLTQTFGQADLLSTLSCQERLSPYLQTTAIRNTWMQRLPLKSKLFRAYFFLYPFAVDRADLSPYNLVVTSCFGYAKGVRRSPDALHICYCHTPMRWVWRTEDYLSRERSSRLKGLLLKLPIRLLKTWELSAATQPDLYVANSAVVADRLYRAFGIHAVVVPPPIDTARFAGSGPLSEEPGGFYLVLARLVPYKRLDLAIEACTRSNKPLVVIGDGPDRKRLERIAGPTITFLGRAPDHVVIDHARRCRALLFPGEEDFGMTPLEINAAGRPVVAFRGGGAVETIIDGLNGVFFDAPSASSLLAAMDRLERTSWDPTAIQHHAAQFDASVFAERMGTLIQSTLAQRQSVSRPVAAMVAT